MHAIVIVLGPLFWSMWWCMCELLCMTDIDCLLSAESSSHLPTNLIYLFLFSRLCRTGRGWPAVLCPIRTIVPGPGRWQDRWRGHLQYRPRPPAGSSGRSYPAAGSGPPCAAGCAGAGGHRKPAAGAGHCETELHRAPTNYTHNLHHSASCQTYIHPPTTISSPTRCPGYPLPRSSACHVWTHPGLSATNRHSTGQVSDKVWTRADQQTDSPSPGAPPHPCRLPCGLMWPWPRIQSSHKVMRVAWYSLGHGM